MLIIQYLIFVPNTKLALQIYKQKKSTLYIDSHKFKAEIYQLIPLFC